MWDRVRNRRLSGEILGAPSEHSAPRSGRQGREALQALRGAADHPVATPSPTSRDGSSHRVPALQSAGSRSTGPRTSSGLSTNSTPRSDRSRSGDGRGIEAASASLSKTSSTHSEVDDELLDLMAGLSWDNTLSNIARLESIIQSWTDAISETRHLLRNHLLLSKIKVLPIDDKGKTGQGRMVTDGCSESQKQARLKTATTLVDQLTTKQYWKTKCETLLMMRSDPHLFAYTHQMLDFSSASKK